MKKPFIILTITTVVFVGSLALWLSPNAEKVNLGDKENMEQTTRENIDRESPVGDIIFKTSMGDIAVDLFEKDTPKTVENFLALARSGFYDGTRFHRVIDGFMIQGGDPLSKDLTKEALWGTGDPGYRFEDEIVSGLSNTLGTLSMANSGPDTNGSQFFINVGENTFLDGKHTVFGRVVSGMDIVITISKVATNGKGKTDRPIEPIVLEQVSVNN